MRRRIAIVLAAVSVGLGLVGVSRLGAHAQNSWPPSPPASTACPSPTYAWQPTQSACFAPTFAPTPWQSSQADPSAVSGAAVGGASDRATAPPAVSAAGGVSVPVTGGGASAAST